MPLISALDVKVLFLLLKDILKNEFLMLQLVFLFSVASLFVFIVELIAHWNSSLNVKITKYLQALFQHICNVLSVTKMLQSVPSHLRSPT